ncbi:MuSashI [Aphelenchoides bicaudatus]|nr:MuSashI [Aphelenchoides bicaudatus]
MLLFNTMCNSLSDPRSIDDSDSNGKSHFSRAVDSIINGKLGKMFVGGLSSYTTANDLRFYFSRFGSIDEAVVMKDAKTQLSRCFGFVVFNDPSVIDSICTLSHYLNGKKIDPKPAIRNISPARSVHNIHKKLFIGGIPQYITACDLKEYFSTRFGEVEDVALKFDFNRNAHRGFGFITFFDNAVSGRVSAIRYHRINGKIIETKPAQKKEFVNLTPTIAPIYCGFPDKTTANAYCLFNAKLVYQSLAANDVQTSFNHVQVYATHF